MKPVTDFVAVDVETTGLDFETEAVIEVAAVRFAAGAPQATFTALLPAPKPLSAMARLLTGLDEDALHAAPPCVGTLRDFLDFAGAAPLVAHNAEFDAAFLRRALEREGLPAPAGPWLDSLLLARAAWPDWESHRLEALAERLHLDAVDAHRALPDARRAGEVFVRAQARLAALPAGTQADLSRLLGGDPVWGTVFAAGPVGETSELPIAGPEAVGKAAGAGKNPDPRTAAIAAAIAKAWEAGGWPLCETPATCDDAEIAWLAARRYASGGRRVLLAVPSREWERLRAVHGGPEDATAALGEPQGYWCRSRWHEIMADAERRLSPEERRLALPLAVWAAGTPSGWLGDCRGFSAGRARRLAAAMACDAYEDDPAARAARAAAENADVILVTHAALFAHLRWEGALLPSADAVVFAGAEALPDAAVAGCGCAVSFFRLRFILQALRLAADRPFGLWPALADAAAAPFSPEAWFEPERQLQRFLQKLAKSAKRRAPYASIRRYAGAVALEFDANPEPVLLALKEQEDGLRAWAERVSSDRLRPEAVRIADRLRAFRLDFARLCDAKEAGVYWVEEFSNPHKAVMHWVPEDLGPVFGERLHSWFRAGSLLSPALASADGGTRFFAGLLGWPASPPPVKQPPAEIASVPPFLLAPFVATAVSAPVSTESAPAFAELLVRALEPFPETGFWVFLPSFGVVRAVQPILAGALPGRALWAQHLDGGPEALVRLFASARGGVVLATEGIEGLRDATGAAPAVAVIARMPLPSGRDPWLEARGEALRAEGRNVRRELWHPAAVLRLKREVARLGRDGGPKVYWCLDARASGDGLGVLVARSLPAVPQPCSDLAALQAATRRALECSP